MDTGCEAKLVDLIALKITQYLLARPASNLQLLTDIIREFWGTNLYIWLQLVENSWPQHHIRCNVREPDLGLTHNRQLLGVDAKHFSSTQ